MRKRKRGAGGGGRAGCNKTFFKIGMTTLQRYPVGQKIHQIPSMLHGFLDISIFVFCNFCEKFENSKWPPFLAKQNFFENWHV